jgi:hypothetical protein
MVNNSHQYQQSEQTSLNIDGHQFTTISTKRTIHTNINNANNHLYTVMVNNSHQYQQSEKSPLNRDGQQFHHYQQNKQLLLSSDGQQFTPISTKRTTTPKQCELLTITV